MGGSGDMRVLSRHVTGCTNGKVSVEVSERLSKDKIQCWKCAEAWETCSEAEAVRKGGGSTGKRLEWVQKHCSRWKMTERMQSARKKYQK